MGWVIQSPYSLKEWVRSFDDVYLGNSTGKESACNAGDPGSIPGSGSSSGEGIGYPVQYSWASLVAQMVKNLPTNAGDTSSIPALGRSLGKGNGNSSVLAWESHGQRNMVSYSAWCHKELDKT